MTWKATDLDDKYSAREGKVFVLWKCTRCGRKGCSKLGEQPSQCCCQSA